MKNNLTNCLRITGLLILTSGSSMAAYVSAIGLNISNGGDGNVSHGAAGLPDAFDTSFGYWNNISAGGVLLDAGSLLDSDGSPVTGLTISPDSFEWTTDDIAHAGGTASGDLGYFGFGDNADDNPATNTLTISGIPYASYDVAVLVAWYENDMQWDLFSSTISGVQNAEIANNNRDYNGEFTAPGTFVFKGGPNTQDGIFVYAVQILNTIPEPSTPLLSGLGLVGLLVRRKRS